MKLGTRSPGRAIGPILVASALLFGSAAASTRDHGGPHVGPPPVTPDWDEITLRDCQATCNWLYALDQRSYNLCYACICLVDAAENVFELEAAYSQCEAEFDL